MRYRVALVEDHEATLKKFRRHAVRSHWKAQPRVNENAGVALGYVKFRARLVRLIPYLLYVFLLLTAMLSTIARPPFAGPVCIVLPLVIFKCNRNPVATHPFGSKYLLRLRSGGTP